MHILLFTIKMLAQIADQLPRLGKRERERERERERAREEERERERAGFSSIVYS